MDGLNNNIMKAVLAYRTDTDWRGESNDVRAWPGWQDPRTRTVLPGLLAGNASKLTRYSHLALDRRCIFCVAEISNEALAAQGSFDYCAEASGLLSLSWLAALLCHCGPPMLPLGKS